MRRLEFEWQTPIDTVCQNCPLYQRKATQYVPGSGSENPKIILIGEAPGEEEVKSGTPFVGKSGKLLNGILADLGLDRSEAYVTNAVKCRPEGNATPPKEAVEACRVFLLRDLRMFGANVPTVSLGAIPYRSVTKDFRTAISKVRSKWLKSDDIRQSVLPTFHPVFALRQPTMTRYIKQDIQKSLSTEDSRWKRFAAAPPIIREFTSPTTVDFSGLRSVLKDFFDTPCIVVDVETNGRLNPADPEAELILVGMYAPYENTVIQVGPVFFKILQEYFATYGGDVIGHNLQFDIKWLMSVGIELPKARLEDTILRYKMFIDENRPDYRLEGFARDFGIPEFKELYSTDLSQYNMIDLVATWFVWEASRDGWNPKRSNLHRIEMNASRMLADVERYGIRVDEERLRSLTESMRTDKNRLAESTFLIWSNSVPVKDIEAVMGDSEDLGEIVSKVLNSPKRLNYVLYESSWKSPKPGLAKTKYATDDASLEWLIDKASGPVRSFCEGLREYRSVSKLISVYGDGILTDLIDGRLYPSVGISRAKTGRTASSDPNIQNIPAKIRPMFTSSYSNGKLLAVDLSQIELRVAAFVSQDEYMIEAFKNGYDFHAQTASRMFGFPKEEITKEQRRIAKTLNFGILYGAGPGKVSWMLKCTEDQARRWITRYFQAFPYLKRWIDDVSASALAYNIVESPLGRLRRVPGAASNTPEGRKLVREAVNAIIQGMASDLSIMFTLLTYQSLKKAKSRTLMTPALVHDFFMLDVPAEDEPRTIEIVEESLKKIPGILKQVFNLDFNIPLEADAVLSYRWEEPDKSLVKEFRFRT